MAPPPGGAYWPRRPGHAPFREPRPLFSFPRPSHTHATRVGGARDGRRRRGARGGGGGERRRGGARKGERRGEARRARPRAALPSRARAARPAPLDCSGPPCVGLWDRGAAPRRAGARVAGWQRGSPGGRRTEGGGASSSLGSRRGLRGVPSPQPAPIPRAHARTHAALRSPPPRAPPASAKMAAAGAEAAAAAPDPNPNPNPDPAALPGCAGACPNFAVVCSFLERYGPLLDLPDLPFPELERALQAQATPPGDAGPAEGECAVQARERSGPPRGPPPPPPCIWGTPRRGGAGAARLLPGGFVMLRPPARPPSSRTPLLGPP